MANKLKKCGLCGAEIASNAKNCPQCGGKNKKPVFKKWWFWVIVIIFVGGVLGNLGGGDSATVSSAPPSENTTINSEQSANTASSTPAAPAQVEQKPDPVEQKPDPIVVDVDALMDALNANALNASNTYKGAYVEVTGLLSTIDSGGKYFSLLPLNDEWAFVGVQCYITKEQQSIVSGFAKNQSVTVVGTITSVGEILGYSLKVESIK